MERVLVVTGDETLLDDVLRLVAAAGAQADVADDVARIRARWRLAPVVLLGADRLAAAAAAGLPRRDHTVVVLRLPPDEQVWALAVDIGAGRVLTLPAADGAVVDLLTEAGETTADPGLVVALAGGCGGAGASVLAAGLAVTAARAGGEVLAVDADPLGGGLDLLFGAEGTPGLRWPDLAGVAGRLSGAALREALPSAYGVSILSHPRAAGRVPGPEAMLAVARTGRRSGGLVVADLPRSLGAGPAALAGAADRVLLVVPAELRACAAAARMADALTALSPHVQLVVRAALAAPLAPETIAESLGLTLAGVLRPERGLAAAAEHGQPPAARGRGAVAATCRALLRDLRRTGDATLRRTGGVARSGRRRPAA